MAANNKQTAEVNPQEPPFQYASPSGIPLYNYNQQDGSQSSWIHQEFKGLEVPSWNGQQYKISGGLIGIPAWPSASAVVLMALDR